MYAVLQGPAALEECSNSLGAMQTEPAYPVSQKTQTKLRRDMHKQHFVCNRDSSTDLMHTISYIQSAQSVSVSLPSMASCATACAATKGNLITMLNQGACTCRSTVLQATLEIQDWTETEEQACTKQGVSTLI